ncbi:MAG: nucleotide sugar dehydrogenase [Gemmataceae bacterium]|nr:nucleotide sugar dehydrogenase [Gemmataceae bacterium]
MIGFAGLSHLGLVSSIAAASKGFEVLAFDPDRALCTDLQQGRLPVYEPGLAKLLETHRERIRFTPDVRELRECDVNYLSLDVPTDAGDRSDVSVLHERMMELLANSAPGTALVLLSQVSPGFTRRWEQRLRSTPEWRDLSLYYQVETLILGRALERALRPERFIVGCDDPRQPLPAAYRELLDAFGCPIFPMRYESAELTKLAINMYLVSSVSVTNTLADLCEKLGADWAEIVPTLKLDPRIGPSAYLAPGLGLSGGNLERDLATVRTLANEVGADAGVVDAWVANSRQRRDWVLRVLHSEVLTRNDSPTVAVWGLAYKPDTASLKNSPAVHLIEALRTAWVRAYDPRAVLSSEGRPHFRQVDTALDACRDADALAIVTPWREFALVNLALLRERMRGRTIVDPFGVLDKARCMREGFDHVRLGEPLEVKETVA